jgi:hypothetical protein
MPRDKHPSLFCHTAAEKKKKSYNLDNWTVLLVCCSYFVFLAPNVILSVFDYDAHLEGTIFQGPTL